MKTVASLGAAIVILAACGGASGGTSGQSGDSSAHAINKTVSFQDSAGTTTITVMSARVSDTGPWLNLSGEPVKADGVFVIVGFTFDSPWTASQLLEVKGGDGKLYGPKYSDNPQTLRGAAKKDPNHFTEVFDIPREAANGAVLEIHIGQNYRDPLGEPPTVGRTVPRGYAAQEVDLGLGSGVTGTTPTAVNATVPTQAVAATKAPTNATATPEPTTTATPKPTPTPAPLVATAIGVGANFACAIVAGGGSVVCWGGNASGQLGNGATATALRPVLVSGVTDAAAVAVDSSVDRACVLHAAGTVSCWGDTRSGKLGNNPPPALTPVAVPGISGGTAISMGGVHQCVLHATGAVSCWGYNSSGELGDGTNQTSMTPVAVLGISDATAITAGQSHSCALHKAGTVSCWGYNLASGNAGGATPALVPGITGVTSISAGGSFTCALRSDTSVWCWGTNQSGQMGSAFSGAYSKVPVQVAGVTGITAIGAGQYFVCAVRSDARVLCWGDNNAGVLGDGSTGLSSALAVMPVGLTDIKAVSGGNSEACSLGRGGSVKCWGAGALGDGTQNASRVPVTVWGP
jgi:alpha-tubulin suppressor-like RCC1 family protein